MTGPTMRSDSGHELHVSGSGGAERVARQHQSEPDNDPESRRGERDATRAGRRHPDAGGCHRRGQQRSECDASERR